MIVKVDIEQGCIQYIPNDLYTSTEIKIELDEDVIDRAYIFTVSRDEDYDSPNINYEKEEEILINVEYVYDSVRDESLEDTSTILECSYFVLNTDPTSRLRNIGELFGSGLRIRPFEIINIPNKVKIEYDSDTGKFINLKNIDKVGVQWI